jgi:hypothetical protein
MNHNIGIWIDHRRAVIVALTNDGETLEAIESHVEKHPERGGDSPMKGSYEAHQVPADDRRQRALTGDLNRYYDAVIAVLPENASVVIFGPGEAKGELHKRIKHTKHQMQVLADETADKMSDKQIIAKVHAHFGKTV